MSFFCSESFNKQNGAGSDGHCTLTHRVKKLQRRMPFNRTFLLSSFIIEIDLSLHEEFRTLNFALKNRKNFFQKVSNCPLEIEKPSSKIFRGGMCPCASHSQYLWWAYNKFRYIIAYEQ